MTTTWTGRAGVALFYGGLIGLALGLAWWWGIDVWSGWRLDGRALWQSVILVAPMLAWLTLVLGVEGFGFGRLRRETWERVRPLLSGLRPADALALAALAGFGEELLFRGVLQPAGAARWGLAAALIATNVLFAIAHAITSSYTMLTFVVGVYFGLTRHLTGNLAVPMLAHGLYDAVALIVLGMWDQKNLKKNQLASDHPSMTE